MKVVSALFLMAAIVLILAIFVSARAGDTLWVQVWAGLLGVLAVARAIDILIEERTH